MLKVDGVASCSVMPVVRIAAVLPCFLNAVAIFIAGFAG